MNLGCLKSTSSGEAVGGGIEEGKDKFHRVGMWVQLSNIPINMLDRGVGIKVDNVSRQSREVIIPSIGAKDGRYLKKYGVIGHYEKNCPKFAEVNQNSHSQFGSWLRA
ncbi:hypothetical protein ACH5RR_023573 [Cinchona calisaya]|uniref:DUF4283 domain-containing protein n=1 Tax=Cinchona calisaya TaxID=153742 RepID=A0ABD2ZCY2_9GENT